MLSGDLQRRAAPAIQIGKARPLVGGVLAFDRVLHVGIFSAGIWATAKESEPRLLQASARTSEPVVNLAALLLTGVRLELEVRRSPGLDIRVISLAGGHLLAGHSGAPVIDSRDRAVGFASGGLEAAHRYFVGHHFERWLQLWRETVAAVCSDKLASLLDRKAQM